MTINLTLQNVAMIIIFLGTLFGFVANKYYTLTAADQQQEYQIQELGNRTTVNEKDIGDLQRRIPGRVSAATQPRSISANH